LRVALTIKEEAKEAGVSHTTVSLVINNIKGSRVSEDTRKRVLEVIKKLDYNPNLIAQRLALKKTNSIGLYIPFTFPIFHNFTLIQIVAGIQDVFNLKDFDLVLFSCGKNLWKDRPISKILKQNSVDGIIIVNTRFTTQYFINKTIRELTKLNSNFVLLSYYWGRADINYVGVDYENDSFKSTSHLIDLGHKNIALITGMPNSLVTNRIINGYKKALKRNNITCNPDFITNADYDYQMAYEKTKSLIKKNPQITAIFVAGYEMAPGSLKAVKSLGLNVPKDISIIAYPDVEIFSHSEPPITAVRLPYYDMGKKAAELVTNNSKEKKKIIFETDLIIRESTIKL